MKRFLKPMLMVAVLSMLLCVSAFAANESGLTAAKATGANVTFSYHDAEGTAVTTPTTVADKSVYGGAEKLGVTYSGAQNGAYYLILVTNTEIKSGTDLTAETIEYIDQKTADGTAVDFTVYQKTLAADTTYYVYLASNAGDGMPRTLIGTYEYYAAYTLGDVDSNGDIDVSDAATILDHVVKRIKLTGNAFLAADVAEEKGEINVSDASRILDYVVKRITTFD